MHAHAFTLAAVAPLFDAHSSVKGDESTRVVLFHYSYICILPALPRLYPLLTLRRPSTTSPPPSSFTTSFSSQLLNWKTNADSALRGIHTGNGHRSLLYVCDCGLEKLAKALKSTKKRISLPSGTYTHIDELP